MNNLKYSVKTHQFAKKRQQIFAKQNEKQSMSLQVHDPLSGLSYLVEQSKSEEESRIASIPEYQNIEPQIEIEEQCKTVKFFNKNPRKVSYNPQVRSKNSNHEIKETAKIKIPSLSQHLPPHPNMQYRLANEGMREQLEALKLVLYSNEQKIINLVNSVNSLYTNAIELYNNHQQKLKELVNARCREIVSIFKTAIATLKMKDQKLSQLDGQVSLLLNTLKDTKQTLRITKIKQQCIEALQKEQQILQKQKLSTNVSMKQKEKSHNYSQFVYFKEKQQSFSQFSKSNFAKNNSYYFQQLTDEKINKPKPRELRIRTQSSHSQSIQSFFENAPSNCITFKEEFKKSPFEANQILMISNTMPILSKNVDNFVPKQPEYSFRKNFQYSQTPNNFFLITKSVEKDKSPSRSGMKQNLNFDSKKLKLQQILRQCERKQVWLDDLNCLRFKNGTYLLDEQGNAIICSQEEFIKLAQQKILIQIQPKK